MLGKDRRKTRAVVCADGAVPPAMSRHAIRSGLLAGLAGALSALCCLERASAQDAERPRITVAPTIVAQPGSVASLPIKIGPPDIVPKRSFVSLHGFPPTVSLTEGHAVGPGSWAVPLFGLPTLKAIIPCGMSGHTEIVISLIGMDGRLLAEAKTALIVGAAALVPSQEKADTPHEKAPAEPPPTDLAALALPAPQGPAARDKHLALAGADIARARARRALAGSR